MTHNVRTFLIALIAVIGIALKVSATCHDTQSPRIPPEIDSKSCSSSSYTTITKTTRWIVYWLDGYQRSVDVRDYGETSPNLPSFGSCTECWPGFATPYWYDDGTTAWWYQPRWKGNSSTSLLATTHITRTMIIAKATPAVVRI